MRNIFKRAGTKMGLALVAGIALYACENAPESTPVEPSFGMGSAQDCAFNDVEQDIRKYFPGNGPGSSKDAALGITEDLETSCNLGQSPDYTASTFELLKLYETGLEGDLPDGPLGDASTGNAILQAILTMTSPSATEPDLFDPCGALGPECVAWDGWPVAPDLTLALTGPGNMFAVIGPAELGTVLLNSSDPICSGPAAACDNVFTGTDPDTWGFAPAALATWADVQGGNTSVFWGHPIDPTGPTGESPLGLLAGFSASSMPFFADFPGEHQLDVTFCTVEDPDAGLISSIAHNQTATETGTVGSWCKTGGHAAASSDGLFGKLASLARGVFTVRPLLAAPHATSPTGGIGGFASEYYAFETPPDGVLEVLNFPVQDATTSGEIVGADGQPLRVRARTSSSTPGNPTGIENVYLEFVLSNNNGPIPSGNPLISLDPDNQDVVCVNTDPLPSWHGSTPPPGNICRVRTGEDQLAGAGIGVFDGIASTKNGGFSAMVREWVESPSPFTFAEISAGKFNVNPN